LRSTVYEADLSSRTVRHWDTPESVVRAYLGGRGLNVYYLYKYLKPGTDALSPDNVLLFGPGLLTGSGVPNSSRINVTAKSPESGILGDCNGGGFFAAELKQAGVDCLIVRGKADSPCYLHVEDGRMEIRDASPYWGLNTIATQQRIFQDLGGDVQVATIGEAGEKMVRFACVMNGVKNSASRGGLGAVMGSKNLKAVVARGSLGVPICHPNEFVDKVIEIRDYLLSSKVVQVLGRVGTPFLYEVSNYMGCIRTNNSQLNTFEDSLDAEIVHLFVEKMISCSSCVVHCRHRNFSGEGPEYTTEGLVGSNLGIGDTEKVIELGNLCNDLGLDVSSAGTIIAWAIELYQKGYLNKASAGRELKFGDYSGVVSLLHDISKRRGLGDVLAESTRAVAEFGPETKDFLIAVKGLPQSDPHDCRFIKSFALGIATSSRGADHLRSRPTLDILDLPDELRMSVYGQYTNSNPAAYDTKEILVYTHENVYAVTDSVGICKFVCHGFNSPGMIKYEHFSDLIRLVTGLEMDPEELKEVGKRVIDLERAFNVREGVTRKDDTLPKRYFDDPMPLRLTKGHRVDREKFDGMLSRYYALRGWDDNGMLPAQRMQELEAYYA